MNKLFLILAATLALNAFAAETDFQTDTAKLGRKNSNNKDFIFDINQGSSNPRIRANGSTQLLQFSNDGSTYINIPTSSTQSGEIIEVGSANWASAASCVWAVTSSSFANPSPNASCSAPTVTGSVTAPGTQLPAVVFTATTTDTYELLAFGAFEKDTSTTNYNCKYRFSNGTDSSAIGVFAASQSSGGASVIVPVVVGRVKFTSAGSKTVVLQMSNDDNIHSCSIQAGAQSLGEGLTIQVRKILN